MNNDRWKVRFACQVHGTVPNGARGSANARQACASVRSQWTDPVQIRIANSFIARMRGLLGWPALADGQGLLITRCSSVHSMGMRYAIDVLFLDKRGQVLRWQTLQPWRMAFCRASAGVLELSAGSADRLGVKPGSRLLGVDFTELRR